MSRQKKAPRMWLFWLLCLSHPTNQARRAAGAARQLPYPPLFHAVHNSASRSRTCRKSLASFPQILWMKKSARQRLLNRGHLWFWCLIQQAIFLIPKVSSIARYTAFVIGQGVRWRCARGAFSGCWMGCGGGGCKELDSAESRA